MPVASFETAFDESSRTLAVTGEVDEITATTLRDAIASSSDGFTRDLVVDLSQVSFLPSSAVGMLAVVLERAATAGVVLELVAAEGTIAQRVLRVCALPHRVG